MTLAAEVLRNQSRVARGALLFVVASTLIASGMQTATNHDAPEPQRQSQDLQESPVQRNWRWLKFHGEIRERVERVGGIGYSPEAHDTYILSRLRLDIDAAPVSWARIFVQLQDSHAPGFRTPAPGNVVNTLDLNQAFVDFKQTPHPEWTFRIGRQELAFGDERLIGPGPWSNVPRRFDAARVARDGRLVRLDLFAASVVVPVDKRFDRSQTDNRLLGVYISIGDKTGPLTIEPYLFWKSDARQPGLSASIPLSVYTPGIRAHGNSGLYDFQVELAAQRGHAGVDGIAAWAANVVAGRKLSHREDSPRLSAEYNFASGDSNPVDRKHATFDQLFPTNHGKYGIADQIGWQNLHNARIGLGWSPAKKWNLALDYNAFWLATRADALYSASGQTVALNASASSNHVGSEVDLYGNVRLSDHFQLAVGFANLFPGRFLRESTLGNRFTAVYCMGSFAF